MDNPTSKKISAYLKNQQGNGLPALFSKLKVLAEINRQLINYLDPKLAPYCQAANLHHRCLIMMVANGSVATQLHYQIPDLIAKFQNNSLLQTINEIKCKVRPSQHLSPLLSTSHVQTPIRNELYLSAKSAEIVRETAESMKDPKLKAIMQKIASHTRNKENL